MVLLQTSPCKMNKIQKVLIAPLLYVA
uniref:Uncharacterized protein n=1 Tax=Arundo donax TaxID=35708 RepID=A0A0A9BNP1_ARUDO